MAKGKVVEQFNERRRARVRRRPPGGRLGNRYCIDVEAPKPRGFEGRGRPIQFRGCYIDKNEALRKAARLAAVATLPPGKGRRRRKASRGQGRGRRTTARRGGRRRSRR
jgi:hypothetical protein